MAGCARTVRVEPEPVNAASAAVIIVLRSIIATSGAIEFRTITGVQPPLNKPLWPNRRKRAPRQRQNRQINPVPFAYRFRPLAIDAPAAIAEYRRQCLGDAEATQQQRMEVRGVEQRAVKAAGGF